MFIFYEFFDDLFNFRFCHAGGAVNFFTGKDSITWRDRVGGLFGTFSGANYEEACGAESRRDFIHKLQIT